MEDWQELVQRFQDVRFNRNSTALQESQLNGEVRTVRWLQVIPLQGTRYYTSVDLVEFTQIGNAIEGTFRRLSPDSEVGYLWNIRGYAQGDEAFYYAFLADNESGAVSVGAMSLMVADFRPRNYKGQYSRRDLPAGGDWELALRRVEWYKKLPSRYLQQVALLDLDNTLCRGWTILSLARSDAFRDLDGISALRDAVDDAKERYGHKEVNHDTFATETAEAYAKFATLNPPYALEQAASAYVRFDLKSSLFSFAKPLVQALRDRDVAPILVTGAPLELGRQIAAELGIEEVHALEVTDGAIVRNTSTAKGKREIVADCARASRDIVLAAGDSESDLPLMTYAPIKLASPDLLAASPGLKGGQTYEFTPSTDWEHLRLWLEPKLPDPSYPRIL